MSNLLISSQKSELVVPVNMYRSIYGEMGGIAEWG